MNYEGSSLIRENPSVKAHVIIVIIHCYCCFFMVLFYPSLPKQTPVQSCCYTFNTPVLNVVHMKNQTIRRLVFHS